MTGAVTPVTAVGLAEQWLYTVLSADAQLAALVGTRIYAGVAPEGATYPLVTFQGPPGQDLTAPGFRRVFTPFEYDIHCADRVGSIAGLDAIAARVDALLQGQSGYQFTSGAYGVACQRVRVGSTASQVAGVATREIILSYAVIVQEASDQ